MEIWILYSVLPIICPIIYWYFTRNFNYWSKMGINGPKPKLGFGNALDQFLTPKPYLELEWFRRYGKIYGVFNGNKPTLTLGEPELIKTILVKDFHLFPDRNSNRATHPVLKHNLGVVTGEDWKRIRSIISPTFTSGRMKKMYPLVRNCLQELLDVLESYAKDRKDINLMDMYGNYTMDVIAICAFSTKINAHRDPNNPFLINAKKVFNPSLSKVLANLMLPSLILNLLNIKLPQDDSVNQFFIDLTRHIIKDRKTSDNKRNDFIELVLNAEKNCNNNIRDENDINESHHVNEGEEELNIEQKTVKEVEKYITEDEIIAQAWIFFAAGYETTATTLAFCSYRLALNPEVQQKLYSEVIASMDSNGEIDYDLLAKLPYLDAVISETLRIDSPLIRIGRKASEDYKLGDTAIRVYKGQQIKIPIYAIHHSEEFYESANQFIPERFLPENRHKIIPYTYLPFGAGPRSCIGMRFALMEAKLGLAQIISRYKFFRSSKTEVPFSLRKNLILHSPKQLVVGIQERL